MIYRASEPLEPDVLLSRLNSSDDETAAKAIIDGGMHSHDVELVESYCIRFLTESPTTPDTIWKKRCACTALGHLSRRFRVLDLARVVPLLQKFVADQDVSISAQTALDEIREDQTTQRC